MTMLAIIVALIALAAIAGGVGEGLPEDGRSGTLFYAFATLATLILLVVFVSAVGPCVVAPTVSQLSQIVSQLSHAYGL